MSIKEAKQHIAPIERHLDQLEALLSQSAQRDIDTLQEIANEASVLNEHVYRIQELVNEAVEGKKEEHQRLEKEEKKKEDEARDTEKEKWVGALIEVKKGVLAGKRGIIQAYTKGSTFELAIPHISYPVYLTDEWFKVLYPSDHPVAVSYRSRTEKDLGYVGEKGHPVCHGDWIHALYKNPVTGDFDVYGSGNAVFKEGQLWLSTPLMGSVKVPKRATIQLWTPVELRDDRNPLDYI